MGLLSWLRSMFGGGVPSGARLVPKSVDAQFDASQLRHIPVVQRALEVDRIQKELEAISFFSKIVGTSYENEDGTSRQMLIAALEAWQELELKPEPANPFHDKAVAVVDNYHQQVGYLDRRLAEEVTNSWRRGDRWKCFVSEITGEGYRSRGVNIYLLRYSPEHLARPIEEREFERLMNDAAVKAEGFWFYARIIGLSGNQDAVIEKRERWKLISRQASLQMRLRQDDGGGGERVTLLTDDDMELGDLSSVQSRRVIMAYQAGQRWIAVFRDCQDGPKLKPIVAMLCLGVDASQKAELSGGRLVMSPTERPR